MKLNDKRMKRQAVIRYGMVDDKWAGSWRMFYGGKTYGNIIVFDANVEEFEQNLGKDFAIQLLLENMWDSMKLVWQGEK